MRRRRRTAVCSGTARRQENGGLFRYGSEAGERRFVPVRRGAGERRFVPPAVLAVRTAICSPCGAGREDGDLFPLWGWP